MYQINPIIKEFEKINLLNQKNFIVLNNKTRDKNCKVFKDTKTGIIVLEKNYHNNLTYEKSHYYKATQNKKILGHKILPKNNEDEIRYNLFKKYINNKRVCDFGCNFGKFLKIIKPKAKEVYGVEINANAHRYLKNSFNIKKKIKDFRIKFDTITMFHTLEHLTNQVNLLKTIKSKLIDNGKFIIEVPHANDFLLNYGPKKFKNFSFWSQHLVLHTKASLKKILNISGFKTIKVYGYQRYNYANHYYWINYKKPGGHIILNNRFDEELLKLYELFLKKYNYTDTLIAVASK